MNEELSRRRLLSVAATTPIAWGGIGLMGCSTNDTEPAPPARDGARVLLAYFSRAGENYYYGGRTFLQVGNSEVLAGLISARIACDVHRVEAADPYSEDYDDAVARNVREQDADARPCINGPLPDLGGYDVVLMASGLWNVRPPMIMRTFTDGLDFTGKTVLPVVTYAVSGEGSAPAEYAQACRGARLGETLAIRGEEVSQAVPAVDAWLARTGLR